MPSYQYLTYELLNEGTIARVVLNRPKARNAQSPGLLVEFGDAMLAAEADDQVRVEILCGAGRFSPLGLISGHVTRSPSAPPGPASTAPMASTRVPAPGLNGACCKNGISISRTSVAGAT
jgi:enoyl-CoA hydratase/carnithine racemase